MRFIQYTHLEWPNAFAEFQLENQKAKVKALDFGIK